MKTVRIEEATLDSCVEDAQHERVVLTRDGSPVALIVGLAGLDEEQVELGSSATFWEMIAERRTQKTISRADLERSFFEGSGGPPNEGETAA